nr:hypothetical protein BaRGS_029513 [Batillaria attramentaria]
MWRLLFCLGTPVLNVSDTDNITVVTYRGSAPFIEGRGGGLYVNETIDLDANEPNDTRVNYALLAVTVTDIDDNDPIFNSSVYSLNVTEENNSFVLVWEETQPLIDAYDQDIQVNDPLKFSLLNPNDEAVLKINETRKFNETIQVQLQRIFDRETEPSKSVVLKVEQVNNPRRSALATLTLHVLDINDNRPLFTQDTYSVSIAEHTAKGSSVVMGENAEFNYTLLAHQDIFDIETLVVGHDRVGVITVKDSAALDRENRSQLQITVGTQELTNPEGGDCSTGHCNATITVTLTDINDNDPVFPSYSYNLIVRNNFVSTVIGTTHD